ncbi:hypothetical protein ACVNPS_07885 [Candidatus Bipolaricaulota sp. J31]
MRYRRACLADLLGDFVAYRSLRPQDSRLPGLPEFREELGLGEEIPRKGTRDYARVVIRILAAAQRLRGEQLRRIVYIGDTRHNDGRTIAALGELVPVRGFIAAEEPEEPSKWEVREGVMYANRWEFLERFPEWLQEEGFPLDGGTAVVVDLDKTAFGARGRNSGPVDTARMAAAERIADSVLGGGFDREGFRRAYHELNDPRYHPFTGDNQDLVVFAALVVASGVYPLDRLRKEVSAGRIRSFPEFLAACVGLPPGLAGLRGEVAEALARGDPTPFKAFRRLEYEETLARMDVHPDGIPPERVLAEEIVITPEVWEFAEEARAAGALLFGLTDKPDEASLPPPGRKDTPLHRARMKVLGAP